MRGLTHAESALLMAGYVTCAALGAGWCSEVHTFFRLDHGRTWASLGMLGLSSMPYVVMRGHDVHEEIEIGTNTKTPLPFCSPHRRSPFQFLLESD